jgi:hypothetical protein
MRNEHEFEFSLVFTVKDGAALVAAARQRAIADGICGDDESATEIIGDDDYALAARMLLDPGCDLTGCDIIDAMCE